MEKSSAVLIAASAIIGSSVSLVLTDTISQKIPFNFFSKTIPGVSDELIGKKTFDLVEFLLTVIFTVLIFLMNYFFIKLINSKTQKTGYWITSLSLLFFSLFIFIQTRFISFSKTNILIYIFILEAVCLSLNFLNTDRIKNILKIESRLRLVLFTGGIFAGFYLLLLLNQITAIATLPVLIFVLCPILFLFIGADENKGKKILSSFPAPFFLIPVFFPTNLTYLLVFGVFGVLIWAFLFKFKPGIFLNFRGLNTLYPAMMVFLLVYNPNFFMGNFDSVEEGFFLGWVQRLFEGQVLYKDVAVYHPPLLIWGIYAFSLVSGFSIYSERLFLHILQITAAIIYFIFLQKVFQKTWIKVLLLLLFASLTQTLVRNNVEIRLCLGLLSLLPLFEFFKTPSRKMLILSGFLFGLSFYVSLEVGLVSAITTFFALNFLAGKKIISLENIKNNGFVILGFLAISVPVLGAIYLQGGLNDFYSQASFYAAAFSKGYFNSPVERGVSLSYFHFHIFNEYLSSHAFFWEVTKLSVIGSGLFFLLKFFIDKEFSLIDKKLLTLSIFGMILFRVVLGRSDWYHFLFALIVGLIFIGLIVEKLNNFRPVVGAVLVFALFFYVSRAQVSSVFLENQLFKMQTYGRVVGDFDHFNFERGKGIPVDINQNADAVNKLVEKITSGSNSQDKIFAYPWMPEIYFYTNRQNATKIDEPYAFFTPNYQSQMISELEQNNPKFIIYNRDLNFGGLSAGALPDLNKYLTTNYNSTQSFGNNEILVKKQ